MFIAQFVECWKRVYFPKHDYVSRIDQRQIHCCTYIYIHHAEFWVTVFGLCCFLNYTLNLIWCFHFYCWLGWNLRSLLSLARSPSFKITHMLTICFVTTIKEEKKIILKRFGSVDKSRRFTVAGFVLRWSYVTDGTLKSKN